MTNNIWDKSSRTVVSSDKVFVSDTGKTAEGLATVSDLVSVVIENDAGTSLPELGYTSGVTSAIQAQIDGKLNTSGGTLTGDLTIQKSSGSAVFSIKGASSADSLLEVGNSLNTGRNAIIDFHYGTGTDDDYNIRMENYADNIMRVAGASTIAMEVGGAIYPVADDAYNLGNATNRWDDIYATNTTIQTSDEREKNSIEPCELGLNFVKALEAISFKWNDEVEPEIIEDVSEEVQETEEITIEEKYIDIVDGKPIQKTRTRIVKVPLFDELEITNEDGEPVLDDKNKPLKYKVPRMKTVIKKVVIKHSVNKVHNRKHYGFTAQSLKTVVENIGIDPAKFAPFIQDQDKPDGRMGIRYSELIAPLYKAVQELSAKIDALENTV